MKREELLQALEMVAPALAVKIIVPIFACVCFTGSRVMANNDRIAISAPLKTDFKGAVPGALLINLLKASRADEIKLSSSNKELRLTAASMDARLAMLPAEEFNSVFTMPKPVQGSLSPIGDDLLQGIQGCMRSVSPDTSVADQLGVTVIPADSKALGLYSYDGRSLSFCRVKAYPGIKDRAIIPAPFCDQLLARAKDKDSKGKLYPIRMEVNEREGFVLATIGDTILFGRLVESPKPMNYTRIIGDHLPADAKKKLIPIPDKLASILDRAVVITEAKGEPLDVFVKDGTRMDFYVRSEPGHELKDFTKVDRHPAVDVRVDAKRLRAGLDDFEDMLITDRCAILNKDEAYYLVATRR